MYQCCVRQRNQKVLLCTIAFLFNPPFLFLSFFFLLLGCDANIPNPANTGDMIVNLMFVC